MVNKKLPDTIKVYAHNPNDGYLEDGGWIGPCNDEAWEDEEGLTTEYIRADLVTPDTTQCQDSVVEENVKFLRDRSNVGVKKYGVTLDRPDLTPVEWVQHLREELADALNYATVVQRKMVESQETEDFRDSEEYKQYVNDMFGEDNEQSD